MMNYDSVARNMRATENNTLTEKEREIIMDITNDKEKLFCLTDDLNIIIGYIVDSDEIHVTCPNCRVNMKLIKDSEKFLEEINKALNKKHKEEEENNEQQSNQIRQNSL